MDSNLIKLFHGTIYVAAMDIVNNGVDIFRSRPDGDFGYGFYATTKKEQAWDWADSKEEDGVPAVVSFYLDTDKLNGIALTGNAWKGYVFQNRIYGAEVDYHDAYAKYDYVEGPLADGKPVRAAIQYRSGLIDKNTFFKKLGNPNGHQLALKTAKAVKNMKFVSLDGRKEESE